MDKKDPKKLSRERKGLYYLGMGLMIVGVILFMSSFFVGFSDDPFYNPTDSIGNSVIGFVMIGVGGFIMNIGARGAAGSGLILDPDKAREDLRPYTSAAGGMLNDALEEVDLLKRNGEEGKRIMVRCPSCRELNDEDARFCKSCGKEL
jgi:hypothetical protein